MSYPLCRRQVLGIGAGIAAAAALSGCSGADEAIAEGTVIADAADVPEGAAIPVMVGETSLILTHAPGGNFRAFSAICPHQGCNVIPDPNESELLVCPCHRSEFNTYTGDVLKGPAEEDLTEFAVEVRDGKVIAI